MSRSLWRRLRYGAPLVVVSGLPRSGTSMMMRMLVAGGIPPLVDGVREADVSNPNGYFEFEPVKDLDKRGDLSWLPGARGKAVKIISFLLTYLPETSNYDVIVMHRDLDEVLASQQSMLARRGESSGEAEPAAARQMFTAHLAKVERFLGHRSCFRTLHLQYRDVVNAPEAAARTVQQFLGRPLDIAAMTGAVDATLYRNRA